MPKVNEIKKTMKKQIPADLMAQIEFPKPKENQPEAILSLVNQMDNTVFFEEDKSASCCF